MSKAIKLLNPGPVTLTSQVRNALLKEDICHREEEFSLLQNSIISQLLKVYPETQKDYVAILITGSGTAAVEAMVSSLVPKSGKALVLVNGVYGERMEEMLILAGKTAYCATSEWTEGLNLLAAEKFLQTDPDITHVLAVHHETTTGRLNDIEQLAELCQKYNKQLLLDSVSSFAGEEIKFKNWQLAACAATANKCLHSVPGISFVIVHKNCLENKLSAANSLYLDLFKHYHAQKLGSTAFTPAIHACYALDEALKELFKEGGWISRHESYKNLSRQIFQGLKNQNIKPLLTINEPSSVVLTAYQVPNGYNYTQLHDFIKSQGYVIYAGLGKFSSDIFRISVMGDFHSIDAEDLLRVFEQYFSQNKSKLAYF